MNKKTETRFKEFLQALGEPTDGDLSAICYRYLRLLFNYLESLRELDFIESWTAEPVGHINIIWNDDGFRRLSDQVLSILSKLHGAEVAN